MEFSPANRTLAIAGANEIQLCDVTKPAHPIALGKLPGAAKGMAFSSNGHTLFTVTNSSRWKVQSWNVDEPTRPIKQDEINPSGKFITTTAFSSDRRTLAVASVDDSSVRLYDLAHPDRLTDAGKLSIENVKAMKFRPDGQTLATSQLQAGDVKSSVQLWNLTDRANPKNLSELPGITHDVNAMAWSSDGRTLATSTHEHSVQLWKTVDPGHPTALAQLPTDTGVAGSVAFSPNGFTLVVASGDHTVRLWNIADPDHPTPVGKLPDYTGNVTSLAFSPDGRTLAASIDTDHAARLWDIPLTLLTGDTDGVLKVSLSSDGRTVLTAGHHAVQLWNVASRTYPTKLAEIPNDTGADWDLAFSPDGRKVATGGRNGSVRLWNVANPTHPTELTKFNSLTDDTMAMAFSPDGRTLAISGDKKVRLWDIATAHPTPMGGPIHDMAPAFGMAFSSDGQTLATLAYDAVRLWDVTSPTHPTLTKKLTGNTCIDNTDTGMAPSPNGRTLTRAESDAVQLWRIASPALTGKLTGNTYEFCAIAFSSDNRTLAIATSDWSVQLWNVADLARPAELAILTGHTAAIRAMAFSSDGRTLATAGDDGSVRLWSVPDLDQAISRICATTRNALTLQDWQRDVPGTPFTPPCREA